MVKLQSLVLSCAFLIIASLAPTLVAAQAVTEPTPFLQRMFVFPDKPSVAVPAELSAVPTWTVVSNGSNPKAAPATWCKVWLPVKGVSDWTADDCVRSITEVSAAVYDYQLPADVVQWYRFWETRPKNFVYLVPSFAADQAEMLARVEAGGDSGNIVNDPAILASLFRSEVEQLRTDVDQLQSDVGTIADEVANLTTALVSDGVLKRQTDGSFEFISQNIDVRKELTDLGFTFTGDTVEYPVDQTANVDVLKQQMEAIITSNLLLRQPDGSFVVNNSPFVSTEDLSDFVTSDDVKNIVSRALKDIPVTDVTGNSEQGWGTMIVAILAAGLAALFALVSGVGASLSWWGRKTVSNLKQNVSAQAKALEKVEQEVASHGQQLKAGGDLKALRSTAEKALSVASEASHKADLALQVAADGVTIINGLPTDEQLGELVEGAPALAIKLNQEGYDCTLYVLRDEKGLQVMGLKGRSRVEISGAASLRKALGKALRRAQASGDFKAEFPGTKSKHPAVLAA